MMLVSGQKLRNDHVDLLATLVGGELGERLRDAIVHDCSIMMLSVADREQILASLEEAPWPLLGLREKLVEQRRGRRRATEERSAALKRARAENGVE